MVTIWKVNNARNDCLLNVFFMLVWGIVAAVFSDVFAKILYIFLISAYALLYYANLKKYYTLKLMKAKQDVGLPPWP